MTALLLGIQIIGVLAMMITLIGAVIGISIIWAWVTFISCAILYVVLKTTQMTLQTRRYIKKYLEESDNEKQE